MTNRLIELIKSSISNIFVVILAIYGFNISLNHNTLKSSVLFSFLLIILIFLNFGRLKFEKVSVFQTLLSLSLLLLISFFVYHHLWINMNIVDKFSLSFIAVFALLEIILMIINILKRK